jgi:carbamoyltransferase
MNIVGINDGHNASVALSVDGKIVAALSEERPTRIKNYWGFPTCSLAEIYTIKNKEEIDFFGIFRESSADFLIYLWGSSIVTKKYSFRWFAANVLRTIGPYCIDLLDKIVPKSLIINFYAKRLSVDKEKIVLVNHHRAHAESAVFNLESKLPWLIFTVDAEGDLESGSVYSLNAQKFHKLTSISRDHSLGYFYTWITEYLGMKPNEHEFKVMGLEPYVRKNNKDYKRVEGKLNTLFSFEGLNYVSKLSFVSRSYKQFLKRKLYKERFDNIAAAAQITLEQVVTKWVENWIRHTGIKNIALSGGTMMNVKLVQKLASLDNVERCYVVPSSGDESTVFGVCNYINQLKDGDMLQSLKDLYLGRSWSNDEIQGWIKEIDRDVFEVRFYSDGAESEIAQLLSTGCIVARFNGRDEFGARALGNRSILAHPSNPDTISTINKLIKDRDFWMPFTPSIIEGSADLYIRNPKRIYSPYMAMTFESTELGAMNFAAATHPYDKTMRIQMVTKEWNPSFYEILERFGEITGIFGVLNTSFNLHGEPNVFSPDDALRTVVNSGLEYLAIGNYILRKKLFN